MGGHRAGPACRYREIDVRPTATAGRTGAKFSRGAESCGRRRGRSEISGARRRSCMIAHYSQIKTEASSVCRGRARPSSPPRRGGAVRSDLGPEMTKWAFGRPAAAAAAAGGEEIERRGGAGDLEVRCSARAAPTTTARRIGGAQGATDRRPEKATNAGGRRASWERGERRRHESTANQRSTRSRQPNLMRSRPSRGQPRRTATSLFTAAAGELRAAKRSVEGHNLRLHIAPTPPSLGQ